MSLSLKSTAAISTAVVLTAAVVCQRKDDISKYYHEKRGFQGMLRSIWLGDHLPPAIRKSLDELNDIKEQINKCESQLDHIESSVQRAMLESVDGPTSNKTALNDACDTSKEEIKKQIFQQNPELRKDIGLFSTRLDRLAARVDSVWSHSDNEVKRRKKQLSDKIVSLMNALDTMLASLH
jgi:chromosome segregation ATPase